MAEQKIICGDNIEVMKTMEDNSVDSIVTDCPYGLGVEPDPFKVMKDWIEQGYHAVKGTGGFMNKEWDKFVPQPNFWKEAYRVLKPGGHVLAFFGTRTYDWGVMAMRFAGFEIRDLVEYIYGTGFPKSLDISKQIDKAAGAERKVIGKNKAGSTSKAFNLREQYDGTDLFLTAGEYDVTVPSTTEAKEWEGWGTALKPAHEPIVLARKPISEKTVAANVLKHGVGGINIDSCRIGSEEIKTQGKRNGTGVSLNWSKTTSADDYEGSTNVGRFPANLILGCNCETEEHQEGCPVKELDRQSGQLTSGKVNPNGFKGDYQANIYGKYAHNLINPETVYGDTGGASRFFYIAKPTQFEKERGLKNFELKDPATVTDFRPTLKSNPENWSNGTETPYTRTTQRKNIHPTVKPVSLLRYLVKMVTAKGGICLDPYNGSGTTGIACKMEGINYIGIEQNEYDCEISKSRIAIWSPENIQQRLL